MSIRSEIRKRLAEELVEEIHGVVFPNCATSMHERSRADELEKMIAAFPGLNKVN